MRGAPLRNAEPRDRRIEEAYGIRKERYGAFRLPCRRARRDGRIRMSLRRGFLRPLRRARLGREDGLFPLNGNRRRLSRFEPEAVRSDLFRQVNPGDAFRSRNAPAPPPLPDPERPGRRVFGRHPRNRGGRKFLKRHNRDARPRIRESDLRRPRGRFPPQQRVSQPPHTRRPREGRALAGRRAGRLRRRSPGRSGRRRGTPARCRPP